MIDPSSSEKGGLLVPSGVGASTAPADFRRSLLEYIRFPECKRLLKQISLAQQKHGYKTVAVMSYHSGEGKSFFVSALSLAAAMHLGQRVLIVDTVSPTRQRSLFTECLLPAADEGKKRGHRGHGTIDLVTTRESEDADAEVSDFGLKDSIASMGEKYDLVLLDTCALSKADRDFMDPEVVAGGADAALIVASPKTLDKNLLQRLLNEFKRIEIPVMGVVLNRGGDRA